MFTFWKLLVMVVLVIAASVLLFWTIDFLAGFVWLIIKVVAVVLMTALVIRYLLRKARTGS